MTRFRCDPDPKRIDQSQDHLGDRIAVVTSGIDQLPGEEMSKLQHSQKFVEEIHSAKVRQTCMITGDSEISRRSPHSDTDFTKSEVSVRISKVEWHSDKQGLR
jgi:hypothetical protein